MDRKLAKTFRSPSRRQFVTGVGAAVGLSSPVTLPDDRKLTSHRETVVIDVPEGHTIGQDS